MEVQKNGLTTNLKIGTNIIIDEENNIITAYTTPESFRFSAKEKIKEAEDFLDNAKKDSRKIPAKKKAKYYLKRAKQDLKKI